MEISHIIASRLGLTQRQVEATVNLLAEGATIPFISRYRKEATGGLNEVQIAQINDLNDQLTEFERRKAYIIDTIEAQGKLTDELRERIEACEEASALEDLYLPFKPKRKTRAEAARQKGLEPLTDWLMRRQKSAPEAEAGRFVTDEVPDVEAALQGARDIIAERINENEQTRQTVRSAFRRSAVITSKVVKSKMGEAGKYRDYFDWSEPLRRCSSHRLLAMRRGEAEGYLRVDISPAAEDECLQRLKKHYVHPQSSTAHQVEEAVDDAYKRLLKPSIENEAAAESKAKADEAAISVFAENLRQLLLAAPLGQKRIMGIDPGFRTGCKLAVVDATGKVLETGVARRTRQSASSRNHLPPRTSPRVGPVGMPRGPVGRPLRHRSRGRGRRHRRTRNRSTRQRGATGRRRRLSGERRRGFGLLGLGRGPRRVSRPRRHRARRREHRSPTGRPAGRIGQD